MRRHPIWGRTEAADYTGNPNGVNAVRSILRENKRAVQLSTLDSTSSICRATSSMSAIPSTVYSRPWAA